MIADRSQQENECDMIHKKTVLFHHDLIKMDHTNSISEDTVMLCTSYCCIQVNVSFIHKCKKNSMECADRRVKCLTSTGVELH